MSESVRKEVVKHLEKDLFGIERYVGEDEEPLPLELDVQSLWLLMRPMMISEKTCMASKVNGQTVNGQTVTIAKTVNGQTSCCINILFQKGLLFLKEAVPFLADDEGGLAEGSCGSSIPASPAPPPVSG